VISLSPCLFLDSSLHFLVLLECLLVVKSLIEFLLEQVSTTCFLSYLIALSACFVCSLFASCLLHLHLTLLLIESSGALKDLDLIYLYIRIKQRR
jgi:hypothetical protein